MWINENNKYTSHANYFYNDYIDMYCVVGTTLCVESFDDLADLFESTDLLHKVEMPEYITEDYDETEW